jgi:hypothetical protein
MKLHEWYKMPWVTKNDMNLHEITWMTWNYIKRRGLTWNDMKLHAITWNCIKRMARNDMTWPEITWMALNESRRHSRGTYLFNNMLKWIADWFAPLPASQVAGVWAPVPSRPTISVEKLFFYCNPASAGKFSSTAIKIINMLKVVSASLGLGLRRTWNTPFKGQAK